MAIVIKQNRFNAYLKGVVQELRNQILDSLGAFCVCCGETERTFLAIDHIGGGGVAHRKHFKNNTRAIYLDIIREGVPKDRFRILCWNCNSAVRWGRICPHQLAKAKGELPSP